MPARRLSRHAVISAATSDDEPSPAQPDIDQLAAFLTQKAVEMRASMDEQDLLPTTDDNGLDGADGGSLDGSGSSDSSTGPDSLLSLDSLAALASADAAVPAGAALPGAMVSEKSDMHTVT